MMMPNFANLSALRGSYNNFSPMHGLMGQPYNPGGSSFGGSTWGGNPPMSGPYGFQPHNPMQPSPAGIEPAPMPVHNPMQMAPNLENPIMPARNPMQPAPNPYMHNPGNPYMRMTALMPQGAMRRSPGQQF